MATIKAEEASKLQSYLQNKFKNNGFTLKLRDKAKDSAEVLLNGEFIGVIYKDDEDGEVSFDLNMAILEEDL